MPCAARAGGARRRGRSGGPRSDSGARARARGPRAGSAAAAGRAAIGQARLRAPRAPAGHGGLSPERPWTARPAASVPEPSVSVTVDCQGAACWRRGSTGRRGGSRAPRRPRRRPRAAGGRRRPRAVSTSSATVPDAGQPATGSVESGRHAGSANGAAASRSPPSVGRGGAQADAVALGGEHGQLDDARPPGRARRRRRRARRPARRARPQDTQRGERGAPHRSAGSRGSSIVVRRGVIRASVGLRRPARRPLGGRRAPVRRGGASAHGVVVDSVNVRLLL